MAETDQFKLSTYQEIVYDALDQPSISGPPQEEGDAVVDSIRRWGRFVGRAAMGSGDALVVLLGMFDAGLTPDEVLEAMVMHGVIPEPEVRANVQVDGEIVGRFEYGE